MSCWCLFTFSLSLWISFGSSLCPEEQVFEILVATFDFLFSSLDSSAWLRVKLKLLPTYLPDLLWKPSAGVVFVLWAARLKLAAEIKLSSDMDKSTSRRKKKVASFVFPPAKTSKISQFTFWEFFLSFLSLHSSFSFQSFMEQKVGMPHQDIAPQSTALTSQVFTKSFLTAKQQFFSPLE